MAKLTERQVHLLNELEDSKHGWLFVSGGEYRTAWSLYKRGLVLIGSRHWETHRVVTPYTKGWCHTVEKKKPPSSGVVTP